MNGIGREILEHSTNYNYDIDSKLYQIVESRIYRLACELELERIEEYKTHANQINRPMIEDVSMIGVGMSSDGSCGLLASVTVATELVMLGVSGKKKNYDA